MKKVLRTIEVDSSNMELLNGSPLFDIIQDDAKLGVLEEKKGATIFGEFLTLHVAIDEGHGLPLECCKKIWIRLWTKRFFPDDITCRECVERLPDSVRCRHFSKNIKLDDAECDWGKASRLALKNMGNG